MERAESIKPASELSLESTQEKQGAAQLAVSVRSP